MLDERTGLSRQRDEDLLCDILREMRVTADAPKRRRVDRINVPLDKFSKRVPVASVGIESEQRGVGPHL
jgi:hypothetical protein